MEQKESKVANFFKTVEGERLLKQHQLRDEGFWEVKGEDPNKIGIGQHYEPHLGYFEGTLGNIIALALDLPGFGNGRIVKLLIHKADVVNVNRINILRSKREKLQKELKVLDGALSHLKVIN